MVIFSFFFFLFPFSAFLWKYGSYLNIFLKFYFDLPILYKLVIDDWFHHFAILNELEESYFFALLHITALNISTTYM